VKHWHSGECLRRVRTKNKRRTCESLPSRVKKRKEVSRAPIISSLPPEPEGKRLMGDRPGKTDDRVRTTAQSLTEASKKKETVSVMESTS